MTMPNLSPEQRERLGRLLWTHIDGVAENVERLLHAIDSDSLLGLRIVAAHEWERCCRAAGKAGMARHALPRRQLTGPV